MKNLQILALLLLASCSSGSSKKINMIIVDSTLKVDIQCSHKTTMVTLFRSEDGKVAKKCGYWGLEGDRISGYWVSGKYEWRAGEKNGFQFIKN